MKTQFANESLEEKPDVDKSYYISSTTESTGLTYLMKLVLCEKYRNETLDKIKKIIKYNKLIFLDTNFHI